MAHEPGLFQELQETLGTCAVELAYEKACHQVEAVCGAEKMRQLQVQILFLKDENDALQSQLAQDDDRISDLQRRNQDLHKNLEIAAAGLENAHGNLRITTKDIETLKAELHSLHGVTMDSTKLLTEKLTLARELSALRTEIEHLRSQATTQQSLLAEKLSLQRQLSAMQVELDTEKRSTQRLLTKEDKLFAKDAKLESRVETLQVDLAKERCDRQLLEQQVQKASTESENRKITLESRLDAFRTKLKSTKEQLKETQAALKTAQNIGEATGNGPKRPAESKTSLVKPPQKRTAVVMDADTIIGTPGNLPVAKRSKIGSSLVGEKSTFSITPFLNRTASLAPESPPAENLGSDGVTSTAYEAAVPEPCVHRPASNSLTQYPVSTRTVTQTMKPGALGNAKLGKANSRAPAGRKAKAARVLEQVTEEIDTENTSSAKRDLESLGSKDALSEAVVKPVALKKTRKLFGGGLGKTLFDEEGGVVKGEGDLLGGGRGFGTLARVGLGGPGATHRQALGADMGTFGAISPLKKDKKAVI